jgi:hypothetical protein
MPLTHSQLSFISEIKEKIRLAQYAAFKAVNTQLIQLYWEIGRGISEKQGESWGKSIVPVLSWELQKEFLGISGFSERNLWLMTQFYNESHNVEFLQPLAAEISRVKRIAILNKFINTTWNKFLSNGVWNSGFTHRHRPVRRDVDTRHIPRRSALP